MSHVIPALGNEWRCVQIYPDGSESYGLPMTEREYAEGAVKFVRDTLHERARLQFRHVSEWRDAEDQP